MIDQTGLESEIEALLANAGISLLAFSLSQHKGNVVAKATIYSPSGTGTDECTKTSRLIQAQLQRIANIQDPEIEVTSPGIDRIIRTPKEWKAFEGQDIKLLLLSENEWQKGRLAKYWGDKIDFIGDKGPMTIDISAIAKARLDSGYKGE
ncbi:MAG: hypothetical protein LLF89_09045 [Spirochaetaceae bacterium]|nr:hypothetical protein [Spirochaetaceae bacterium]